MVDQPESEPWVFFDLVELGILGELDTEANLAHQGEHAVRYPVGRVTHARLWMPAWPRITALAWNTGVPMIGETKYL